MNSKGPEENPTQKNSVPSNGVFVITCNCYEPMFREDVLVRATSPEAAFLKAIRRVARKYKTSPDNIATTAICSK